MSGWQSTETPPKDGVEVLTWDGEVIAIAYRYTALDGKAYWWADGGSLETHPTHWTPLPKPPE